MDSHFRDFSRSKYGYYMLLFLLGGYEMTVKFFNGGKLVYTIKAIAVSYAICYINFSGIEWTSYEIVYSRL